QPTSEGFLLVPGITDTRLPIPILEVIAKLSHLTAKSGIEQHVVERGLGCNAACVFNAAEMNSGSNRRAIGQSRIRDREGSKRIGDRHTDALRTKGSTVRVLEWIRGKPASRA